LLSGNIFEIKIQVNGRPEVGKSLPQKAAGFYTWPGGPRRIHWVVGSLSTQLPAGSIDLDFHLGSSCRGMVAAPIPLAISCRSDT
jgi:hypothetical protein